MTIDEIISDVIAREGGFVWNTADPGGATKFGITKRTLETHRGHVVSVDDVRELTENEARTIYRNRYVETPGFDAIAGPELRGVVIDCGVLHGPANAVRMLQRALRVQPVDGILGPVTLTAANAWNSRKLAILVLVDRLKFIGRLITNDLDDIDQDGIPDNTEFAKGWLARIADQIKELTV